MNHKTGITLGPMGSPPVDRKPKSLEPLGFLGLRGLRVKGLKF